MISKTENEIKSIFNRQQQYQWQFRNTTAEERSQRLIKLRDALTNHSEEIIAAAQEDFLRPFEEEQNQILAIVQVINYTLENIAKWMKPEEVSSPQGGKAHIIYEPKGIVCIIGTWNSPLSTNIHPLVEAIAAGNCVMIKPSEFSPKYGEMIKRIIEEVFNEQEVAVVLGAADVSQELLKLPFDHFFYTGSPRVGRIIMEGAAKHLAGVTLELGGKSPVILDKNINFQHAAGNLVYGKILMGGQICISPDYIFVHEEDVEQFVAHYTGTVNAMIYTEKNVNHYPHQTAIVNDMHYNRLKNLYRDALQKGATVLSGGSFNDELRLIEPTILGNVSDDMLIVNEEIFGPLTFLKTYTNIDDAIIYINERPKPLALYIFSDDKQFQQNILKTTSSGGVTINGILLHNTHPELPFGGINNSGLGNFHGIHGFKTFSHSRAVYTVLTK